MVVSVAVKPQCDPRLGSTLNPSMNLSSGTPMGCQLHPQGYNPHSAWSAALPAPMGL